MRERELTFVYQGCKGAAKRARFVAAVEHGWPTKSLAEMAEQPDEPAEFTSKFKGQSDPVKPGQTKSKCDQENGRENRPVARKEKSSKPSPFN